MIKIKNDRFDNTSDSNLYTSDYLCVRYNFKRNKIKSILDEMIRWDISIKDLETELNRRNCD